MGIIVSNLYAGKLKAGNLIFSPSHSKWRNMPTHIDPETLNRIEDYIKRSDPEKIRLKFTNCKNCGAPLKSAECEYCGTFYPD